MSSPRSWLIERALLPALLVPTRSKFTKLAREMRQRQRWPLDRLHEYQLERLRHLIRHAVADSIWYRELFESAGVSADSLDSLAGLAAYPTTSKIDIQANFPDRMVAAARRSGDWQYVGTRGTTNRVMVVYDFERRDLGRAAEMITYTEDSPFGFGDIEVSVPPDACSVHCGIEGQRADSVASQCLAMATRRLPWNRESISDLRGLVMDQVIRRSHVLEPLPLDGKSDRCADYVDRLRKLNPVQLVALPEYLRALADYILESSDFPPGIPVIRPMGANLPATWRSRIAEAFGGVVREHYGCRELGPIAFDCCECDGMHILMDLHLVEVIRNGVMRDGEVGRVVVTDLHNLAMPMIRYEIGDLARIDRSPCACGRTTPRLHLEGRIEDAFVTHQGGLFTSEMVANFLASFSCIRDFQVIEDGDRRWVIRIVPSPAEPFNSEEIRSQFQRWIGDPRPVVVRTATSILPEESGKFRHCKSASYHRLIAGSQ